MHEVTKKCNDNESNKLMYRTSQAHEDLSRLYSGVLPVLGTHLSFATHNRPPSTPPILLMLFFTVIRLLGNGKNPFPNLVMIMVIDYVLNWQNNTICVVVKSGYM